MMEKIDHAYARAFAGADGRAVMAHLRAITIERYLGADATDAQLRTLEAQRALVHQMEQHIKRGQQM